MVTLIVSVTTGDGVVLAADSRVTYTQGVTRIRTDFTHKIGLSERSGIASSGWASLSGRSIASHVAEFFETSAANSTPELLCDRLGEFITPRIQAHVDAGIDPAPEGGAAVLHFTVVGYDGNVGEAWKLLLPSMQKSQLNTTNSGGAYWHGDWEIAQRILMGICPSIKDEAEKNEQLGAAYQALTPAIDDAELAFATQGWSHQDAVDFAAMLIRTTGDVQRFTNGPKGRPGKHPSVGGPIEIALIDRSGARWIQETLLVGNE